MERRRLGRTGLEVTAMGLGGGGHSKLGLIRGKDHANAVRVVRRALDLGINVIDTSEWYKTESAIGEAIQGRRDEVVLATKCGARSEGRVRTPDEIEAALDQSLKLLRTDVIDIYQVHAVTPRGYPEVAENVVPVLQKMKEKGKIRFMGVTEGFGGDRSHQMLGRAVEDDCWDTVMVGFNFMNPSARHTILKRTRERDVGVFCMFAIRHALTDPKLARDLIIQLAGEGTVDTAKLNLDAPLDFLVAECDSIPEAGYRFCLHEPGIDCILSGTGSVEHLEENFRYLSGPPLPASILGRLEKCFGHIDSVCCN